MRGSAGQGAFTLVELLVVLAVVGVLTSLLLPALNRSRDKARQARCLSSLKQMGIACSLYWDDHGDRTFAYRQGVTNGGVIYWFGWLQNGSEGQRAFDPALGVLYPYLGTRGMGICPSLQYESARFKFKALGPAFGYGYNLNLSPTSGRPSVELGHALSPSRLVVFADSAQVNTFQPPASADHPLLEEFYYVHQDEPTVHFRHGGRAHGVFADGHAGSEKPVEGSIDARLPGARVGRLPPERLILQPGSESSR